MISTLRSLFLSRLLREKVLMVAFALLLLIFWLSSFFGRARLFLADEQKASLTLAEQTLWLSRRAEITAAAEKAASRFDPAKTLDSTQLLAKVTQLASSAGLRTISSGQPVDQSTGQFAIHTLDFTINKVAYNPDLQNFYFSLQAQRPYIGIQKFVIATERSNPPVDVEDARITVYSVEIQHGGSQ